MQRKLRVLGSLLLPILLAGLPARPAQMVVSPEGSGGYRTIQGAINAAAYGDSIYVNPGIYEEHITFKNGVNLLGAGTSHSILRHGYGFEEVLLVRHASSGRIEGLSIERLGSVLAAPAVVLDSASITISDCVVTGAQEVGIEITGATSSPTIERTRILDNGGHGLRVSDGARVYVVGSEIGDNGGCGIFLGDGATAEVEGTAIEGNALSGIVLEGASACTLTNVAINDHGQWGVHASGRSQVDLATSSIAANVSGGVLLTDDAHVDLREVEIAAGGSGILARRDSRLTVSACSILDVQGVGVRVESAASAELVDSAVLGCNGTGIDLASSAPCSAHHLTVAENGGDGIALRGSSVTVVNSIIALNRQAGFRVDSEAVAPAHTLHHNLVWGNVDQDYVGLSRRASDIAAAPGFADLQGRDVSLRPDSPCIGAGTWGETIGARGDPNALPGTTVELRPSFRDPFLGVDWSARLRFAVARRELETVEIAGVRTSANGSLSVSASIFGVWGTRIQADGMLSLPGMRIGSDEDGETLLALNSGFAGVLDGVESWLDLWLRGRATGDAFSLDGRIDRQWPSQQWRQQIELKLGSTLRARVSLQAIDLSPSALSSGLRVEIPLDSGTSAIGADLDLFPDRRLTLSGNWWRDGRSFDASVATYLDRLSRLDATASFAEDANGIRVQGSLRLTEFVFADGTLALTKTFEGGRLLAELGLGAESGARFTLRAEVDLGAWLTPPANRPPIPVWSVWPDDPESGEVIRFDAGASADPDGDIREFWWDFGDGAVGVGALSEHVFTEPGTYDVTLIVSDDDGTATSLGRPLVIWAAKSAPAAVFIWTPISPQGTVLARPLRSGDAVRLDASASYVPGGEIIEYAWDIHADGTYDHILADPVLGIPPLPAGEHPVTLRVADAAGRSDAVLHVIVVSESNPPKADYGISPQTPSILDPVRFIDRSLDPDGAIVAWEWSFGDGRSSRKQDPIHRYDAEGQYEAALTVIDDDGMSGTATQAIVVSRVPEVVAIEEVWAVVIGITDYEDVPDLSFAREDAIGIANWLLASGVPADHIRLLTDGGDSANGGVQASPATLVNVREALGWLRRVADQSDLVLVHFSGHGYRGLDDDGDEEDGVDEYFVLLDTRAGAVDDTALRDDEFGRFLDRIESEHVLILFDGCHSGGLSRSLASGHRPIGESGDRFSDLSLEGRLILSASGEAQEAYESPALEHGVFTHFVLEGLEGAADVNDDRRVTAWELYEYVREEVPRFVKAERGAVQEPQITGEGEARIIVSALPPSLLASHTYEPAVPYVGGAVIFRDQSSGGGEIVSREWTFGDGTTASGGTAEHTYSAAGEYATTLTVADGGGSVNSGEVTVSVAAAGRVIRVDAEAGLVFLSLGAQNGLRLGDRFVVVSSIDESADGILEVVELIDLDSAACRYADGSSINATLVGSEIRPSTQ